MASNSLSDITTTNKNSPKGNTSSSLSDISTTNKISPKANTSSSLSDITKTKKNSPQVDSVTKSFSDDLNILPAGFNISNLGKKSNSTESSKLRFSNEESIEITKTDNINQSLQLKPKHEWVPNEMLLKADITEIAVENIRSEQISIKNSFSDSEITKKTIAKNSSIESNSDKVDNEFKTSKSETQLHVPLEVIEKTKTLDQQLSPEVNAHKFEYHTISKRNETEFNDNLLEDLVLAHSEFPINVVDKRNDAAFLTEIDDQMELMDLNHIYRVQAYAWPHILRNNSTFVINSAKTGKTTAIVAPIINMIAHHVMNEMYTNDCGLIALFLVASTEQVDAVQKFCAKLLKNFQRISIIALPVYARLKMPTIKAQLLANYGIIIATPTSFLKLICDNRNDPLLNVNFLKHLLIDDLDIILKSCEDEFKCLIKYIYKIPDDPSVPLKPNEIQFSVSSREWSNYFEVLYRVAHAVLLVIGDFLEASVYGETNILIESYNENNKLDKVMQFIDDHPLDIGNLVIFCATDVEIVELTTKFDTVGLNYLVYYTNSSEEIRDSVEMWEKKPNSRILITTDHGFQDLNIHYASNLIHYTLPSTWSQFKRRFISISKTYRNRMVRVCKETTNKTNNYTLVLLDESNCFQISRLVDFMKNHRQPIPQNIIELSQHVKMKQKNCELQKQELITNAFKNLPKDIFNFPNESIAVVEILNMFTPAHFVARILNFKSPTAKVFKNSFHIDANKYIMAINSYYMKAENQVLHWPIENGDICIIKSGDFYERACVVDVPPKTITQFVKSVPVTLHLIDKGLTLNEISSEHLLCCAEMFKTIPKQSVEIRLVGVVEIDNELDKNLIQSISDRLKKNLKSETIYIIIDRTEGQTIYFKNLIIEESLSIENVTILEFNLKQFLIKNRLYVQDENMPSTSLIADKNCELDNEVVICHSTKCRKIIMDNKEYFLPSSDSSSPASLDSDDDS